MQETFILFRNNCRQIKLILLRTEMEKKQIIYISIAAFLLVGAVGAELGLGVRMGSGQGNGGSAKGSNNGGNFVDNNGDGSCDNL